MKQSNTNPWILCDKQIKILWKEKLAVLFFFYSNLLFHTSISETVEIRFLLCISKFSGSQNNNNNKDYLLGMFYLLLIGYLLQGCGGEDRK